MAEHRTVSHPDFWQDSDPQAELPAPKPAPRLGVDVGARVWCAGLPYVLAYISDGKAGMVYDPPKPHRAARGAAWSGVEQPPQAERQAAQRQPWTSHQSSNAGPRFKASIEIGCPA